MELKGIMRRTSFQNARRKFGNREQHWDAKCSKTKNEKYSKNFNTHTQEQDQEPFLKYQRY
jgi:hypothetical protein